MTNSKTAMKDLTEYITELRNSKPVNVQYTKTEKKGKKTSSKPSLSRIIGVASGKLTTASKAQVNYTAELIMQSDEYKAPEGAPKYVKKESKKEGLEQLRYALENYGPVLEFIDAVNTYNIVNESYTANYNTLSDDEKQLAMPPPGYQVLANSKLVKEPPQQYVLNDRTQEITYEKNALVKDTNEMLQDMLGIDEYEGEEEETKDEEEDTKDDDDFQDAMQEKPTEDEQQGPPPPPEEQGPPPGPPDDPATEVMPAMPDPSDMGPEQASDDSQEMTATICKPAGPNTHGGASIGDLKKAIQDMHRLFNNDVPTIKAMASDSRKARKSNEVSVVLKHWLELEDALKLYYYVPQAAPAAPAAAAMSAMPAMPDSSAPMPTGSMDGMRSAILVDANAFLAQYMISNGIMAGAAAEPALPADRRDDEDVEPDAIVQGEDIGVQTTEAASLPTHGGTGDGGGSRMNQNEKTGRIVQTRGGQGGGRAERFRLPFSGQVSNSGIASFMRRGVPQLMPPASGKLTGNVEDLDVPVSRANQQMSFDEDFMGPSIAGNTRLAYSQVSERFSGRENTAVDNPSLRNAYKTGTIVGGGTDEVIQRYPSKVRIR